MKKTGLISYQILILVLWISLAGCGSDKGSAQYGMAPSSEEISMPEEIAEPEDASASETIVVLNEASPAEIDASATPISILSKSWSLSLHIERDAGKISWLQTSIAEGGNAISVWTESTSGLDSVYVSMLLGGEADWRAEVNISNGNSGRAYVPKAAINPSGQAVAVWNQHDGVNYSIYANVYNNETSAWGASLEIDYEAGGHAYFPQVVMDDMGNALAAWYQYDGLQYSILSSRYDAPSGSWSPPEPVEHMDTGAFHPVLAGNSSGYAMLTWRQSDGYMDSAWASMYDPVVKEWGEPQLLENDNNDHARWPVVDMNNKGDAIVSWYMYDGSFNSVYSSIYNSSSGIWGEAVLVDGQGEGHAEYPVVSIAEDSNAMVAWKYDNGITVGVYASRYDAGTGGWGEVVQLDSGDTGDVDKLTLALDAEGNAVLIWQKYSVSCKIKASRYDVTTGTWGVMENLCDQIAQDAAFHMDIIDPADVNAYEPQVRFDENGRAVVAWRVTTSDGPCIIISTLE